MPPETLVALVVLIALVVYVLTGGADYAAVRDQTRFPSPGDLSGDRG